MTAPATLAHIAVLDGVELDLHHDHADVFGTTWRWTGERDARGEPLMRPLLGPVVQRWFASAVASLPLGVVYVDYGPLIPIHPQPVDADLVRAAWAGALS